MPCSLFTWGVCWTLWFGFELLTVWQFKILLKNLKLNFYDCPLTVELLVCLSVYMGITISSRVIRLFIKTSYLIFQTILLRSTSSTGTLHRTELSEQMKASINPAMILFPAIILFWLQIEKVWLSCSLASRGGRPWQCCRQDNLCMAWNTQGNKSRNCSGRLPVLCLFLSDWKNWCRYDHFGILLGFLIVLPQSRTGNIEFSLFFL